MRRFNTAKYSTKDREKLINSLRESIAVVPIELQLMYLYSLMLLVFSKYDNGDYYTSLENINKLIAAPYVSIVTELRNYRNKSAHEGILSAKDPYRNINANKFEVDMLAQMCSVTLNWDNSLNLF